MSPEGHLLCCCLSAHLKHATGTLLLPFATALHCWHDHCPIVNLLARAQMQLAAAHGCSFLAAACVLLELPACMLQLLAAA
jgi:hypothetical protein